MLDLLVIGSGSAGVAAAIEASELGAQVAVIEAGTLGGTCVNVGCVPSKTLLRAAEANHRAQASAFTGVSPRGSRVDFGAIVAQKDSLVAELRHHKYADVLAAYGVRLLRGRARFSDRSRLEVDGKPFQARRYIIASGAAAVLPPIPGLRESRPWTYTEALSAPERPESLMIVGAGPIGLELAQAYARLGTRVTVLEALPRIAPAEDEQVSHELERYLREEGIAIHTGALVSNVQRNGHFRTAARFGVEERVFESDQLLVATGRAPRTEGLGLSTAGVDVSPGGAVSVDEFLFTRNDGVLAAGDVAGLPQFVYVAAQSGRIAARNALSDGKERLDLTAVPRVTFTDPGVASVGLSEEEARRLLPDVRTSVLPLDQVPRALAAFDTRGLLKLIVDGKGSIVGMHVLAPEAGELIQEGIIAVRFGLSYRDLIDTYHPYLTAVEGVRLAAQALDTEVTKLSCCA